MLMIALVVLLALLIVFVARQASVAASQARAALGDRRRRPAPRKRVDTETRRSARVFAALTLGALIGVAMLVGGSSVRAAGRAAYLERHAERFDALISKPQSFVTAVIGGVFATGMAIGAYELLAFGMTLLMGSAKRSIAA